MNIEKLNRPQPFVNYVISHIQYDKRMAAILRRADNPGTEYQCWEYLAAFNINLEKEYERLPYATIAAAMAKAKITHDGSDGIGRAIAGCYKDGNNCDQAKAKLRRLLACNSVKEACRVLRPLFSLIQANNLNPNLKFGLLLTDLLRFRFDDSRQRVKSRWAQDFYRRETEAIEEDGEI